MEKLKMKEKQNYEIIKKWNDGLLSFKAAKSRLKYSEQHMYRLKKKLIEKGKDGFIHGNRGRKPSTTISVSAIVLFSIFVLSLLISLFITSSFAGVFKITFPTFLFITF